MDPSSPAMVMAAYIERLNYQERRLLQQLEQLRCSRDTALVAYDRFIEQEDGDGMP